MPAGPGLAPAIMQIAATSAVPAIHWAGRGRAPMGFVKGMALTFGRLHIRLMAGDAVSADMAAAASAEPGRDALAWYADIMSANGLASPAPGAASLRHLLVLMFGLGMRESSGKHCEGRDRSASNTTAETAEAGLFQTSFNAVTASALLPTIFASYRARPSGFLEVFREGVHCSASSLENFGAGDGQEFQRLSKECPAFAVEFAAIGLRHARRHWGPITRKEAEIKPECDAMLRRVEEAIQLASQPERETLL